MYIKKDIFKEICFLVWLRKRSGNTKQLSRRLGKEQIKQQLIDSLGYNENIDKEELIMSADRVKDCQEALKILKEYEDIIKITKRNIICFVCQQNKVFRKFKENRKFKNLAEQSKITRSTIIFKITVVKLFDKYPKTMTS